MNQTQFPIAPVRLDEGKGQLALHPCPGKREEGVSFSENLERDVAAVKDWGAELVISMMEPESLVRDGAANLGDVIQQMEMQWYHLPIKDNDIPTAEFESRWPMVLVEINRLLDQGGRISMHCRGGTGRTSLLAAMILLSRGESWETVERKLKAARPNALTVQCHRDYLQRLFGATV